MKNEKSMKKSIFSKLNTFDLLLVVSKNDRETEPVVLYIKNPQNSTKWVTTFSWIFHLLLIDFSKKIFEIFFTNTRCLWGMWNYVQGQKRRKFIFGGIHSSLRRMLGLK